MTATLADVKARLAQAYATRAHDGLEHLTGPDVPEGLSAWRVGGEGALVVMLPALSPTAPPEVWSRYLARVYSQCVGECPLCGAIAGVTEGMTPGEAMLSRARPSMFHEPSCGALFGDELRVYFDPRTVQVSPTGRPSP